MQRIWSRWQCGGIGAERRCDRPAPTKVLRDEESCDASYRRGGANTDSEASPEVVREGCFNIFQCFDVQVHRIASSDCWFVPADKLGDDDSDSDGHARAKCEPGNDAPFHIR